MMELHLTLIGDASFAGGEGVAGLLDSELQHDACGQPYLRGRSLKGLLAEECANLLDSLRRQGDNLAKERLEVAASALFGIPGADASSQGGLNIADAQLPADLRAAIKRDIQSNRLTPNEVLESLSAIRRRTAMNDQGAPLAGSLRSMRVLLRQTCLIAGLSFSQGPNQDQRALLAACTMSLRRGGSDRNRGLGRLRVRLYEVGADATDTYWDSFKGILTETKP